MIKPRILLTMADFTVLMGAVEGGLFKRAQFREGAHTAHGNHRSNIIYRIFIGVCAFVPRGICGGLAPWGPLPELGLIK
jgi:hypothetical protein